MSMYMKSPSSPGTAGLGESIGLKMGISAPSECTKAEYLLRTMAIEITSSPFSVSDAAI